MSEWNGVRGEEIEKQEGNFLSLTIYLCDEVDASEEGEIRKCAISKR